ncbi:hypothetical protein CcaverHIS002_0101840 [Cutaneotrichosporon cavernicola]|nr:hypothetical protein CcaverHIS002_0101840 [Cutaneotrichosporon cavernicola]BEJ03006.1 hypothetical protein CcaverHIS641_0101810 [Cutaneotrichosporon cavernicola]
MVELTDEFVSPCSQHIEHLVTRPLKTPPGLPPRTSFRTLPLLLPPPGLPPFDSIPSLRDSAGGSAYSKVYSEGLCGPNNEWFTPKQKQLTGRIRAALSCYGVPIHTSGDTVWEEIVSAYQHAFPTLSLHPPASYRKLYDDHDDLNQQVKTYKEHGVDLDLLTAAEREEGLEVLQFVIGSVPSYISSEQLQLFISRPLIPFTDIDDQLAARFVAYRRVLTGNVTGFAYPGFWEDAQAEFGSRFPRLLAHSPGSWSSRVQGQATGGQPAAAYIKKSAEEFFLAGIDSNLLTADERAAGTTAADMIERLARLG